MEYREVISWLSDDKPCTTKAIVEVSDTGNVRRKSFRHWHSVNNGYMTRKDHVYPVTTGRGKGRNTVGNYLSVSIRSASYSVHRLVGLAFIPNPLNKPQINHKDGNKQNNNVENLEWVTNKENNIHARENNFYTAVKGDAHGMSKLKEDQVRKIKIELETPYRGQLDVLANIYGVGKTTIAEIKAGRSWRWL
tara:strand:- start:234 stop:809 length:576 start_codon:yes stop_codon:yes gene_type:complete